jgi:hypothetical protein
MRVSAFNLAEFRPRNSGRGGIANEAGGDMMNRRGIVWAAVGKNP